MTISDDEVYLAKIRYKFAWTESDRVDLLRMAEEGIEARKQVVRVEELLDRIESNCDDDEPTTLVTWDVRNVL
jgi:hypothetical protein